MINDSFFRIEGLTMLDKLTKMFSIKWMIIYGIVPPFFTAIAFFYIFGAARYITDFEENTCEMTYMFEYPQYVVRKYEMRNVPSFPKDCSPHTTFSWISLAKPFAMGVGSVCLTALLSPSLISQVLHYIVPWRYFFIFKSCRCTFCIVPTVL